MVKKLVFLTMLLFLSACTGNDSAENGELPPSARAEGEITNNENGCETTNAAEISAYFTEDTANEYDEFSYDETFDMHEATPSPFVRSESLKFHMKYWFCFNTPVIGDAVGSMITTWMPPTYPVNDRFYDPPTIDMVGSERSREMFIADDGRIIVPGSSGWPGSHRDSTYGVDENMEIQVIVRDSFREDNRVVLVSRSGVLAQIPAFWDDSFLEDLVTVADGYEVQGISYEERENSQLWQWLMAKENAWRITVNDPRPFSDIFQDVSGELWYRYGIQIFLYAGDATIISRRGILSQFPELHEDNFYFDLYVGGGFEMQYIMLHEQPESNLWQLMIERRE